LGKIKIDLARFNDHLQFVFSTKAFGKLRSFPLDGYDESELKERIGWRLDGCRPEKFIKVLISVSCRVERENTDNSERHSYEFSLDDINKLSNSEIIEFADKYIEKNGKTIDDFLVYAHNNQPSFELGKKLKSEKKATNIKPLSNIDRIYSYFLEKENQWQKLVGRSFSDVSSRTPNIKDALNGVNSLGESARHLLKISNYFQDDVANNKRLLEEVLNAPSVPPPPIVSVGKIINNAVEPIATQLANSADLSLKMADSIKNLYEINIIIKEHAAKNLETNENALHSALVTSKTNKKMTWVVIIISFITLVVSAWSLWNTYQVSSNKGRVVSKNIDAVVGDIHQNTQHILEGEAQVKERLIKLMEEQNNLLSELRTANQKSDRASSDSKNAIK